jgi:hypothetical protein
MTDKKMVLLKSHGTVSEAETLKLVGQLMLNRYSI